MITEEDRVLTEYIALHIWRRQLLANAIILLRERASLYICSFIQGSIMCSRGFVIYICCLRCRKEANGARINYVFTTR